MEKQKKFTVSVAPMMDWTDRHCRWFHRLLSKHALLYTEMVVADAVIHGDRDYLIGFNSAEHPVALQIGGSDPAKLSEAAKIGEGYGYDEININIGCPSPPTWEFSQGSERCITPRSIRARKGSVRFSTSLGGLNRSFRT